MRDTCCAVWWLLRFFLNSEKAPESMKTLARWFTIPFANAFIAGAVRRPMSMPNPTLPLSARTLVPAFSSVMLVIPDENLVIDARFTFGAVTCWADRTM